VHYFEAPLYTIGSAALMDRLVGLYPTFSEQSTMESPVRETD